jgi:hypothetical protein
MIRRRVVWASVLVCLALPAAAGAQGLQFGVKAGVSLSTMDFGGEDVALERRTGLLAGGFVTMPIARRLGLQAEAVYVTKGVALEGPFASEVDLDYLELPVLARARLAGPLFAVAGPAFAYRLRARGRTTFLGETDEADLSDEFEPWDVGLAAGLGLTIRRRFEVEVRYTYGLRNIDIRRGDDGPSVTNRAVALSGAFRF